MVSRPLNFLHLSTFYPPYSFGGDAMYIYRLAHALGDLGHHVDVIHCIDAYHMQHPGAPEIKYEDHTNVHRYGLESKFSWLFPLITHQTGKPYLKDGEITDVFNSKAYDVIHYHNISLLGPGILSYQPKCSSPIKLYTTHEHWLICPTHVLWKFNRRPCEKPDCLACTLLAKRPPQIWRYTGMLERYSRYVDRFVSPSRFTAQMHSDRGFPQPVEHLPYFIDQADWDWQNPGPRPQAHPYFLFVGRLEKIKGLDTLIKIWKHVPYYDLVVIGAGRQAEELKAQASENPRVKLLGPKSQRELGALYYHALATIVPSVTYETFGIIIVESFARKTPVIVRDLGALPEVVQDSQGGFIYQTDSDLLNAIEQIGKSESARTELGEKGYQAFIKYWCREAHLQQYFGLLENIAEKKYGGPVWE
jgi:glycosyltransferase involved in cell wall biosynthesis